MTVIERIFDELSNQNKTIASLCEHLGLKSNVVANWKKKPYPPAKYLLIISEYLNVPIDYLYTGNSMLTYREQEIIKKLRDLDERDREEVFDIISMKHERRQKSLKERNRSQQSTSSSGKSDTGDKTETA